MNIFIGSSSEAHEMGILLEVAKIVEDCKINPIRWNQSPSIFEAGKCTLENLEEMINKKILMAQSLYTQVTIKLGTEEKMSESHETMLFLNTDFFPANLAGQDQLSLSAVMLNFLPICLALHILILVMVAKQRVK